MDFLERALRFVPLTFNLLLESPPPPASVHRRLVREVLTRERARENSAMDSLPPRPLGVDESALALEGMYMANPGEFEPVKLPFDDSNAVRHRAEPKESRRARRLTGSSSRVAANHRARGT